MKDNKGVKLYPVTPLLTHLEWVCSAEGSQVQDPDPKWYWGPATSTESNGNCASGLIM